MTSFSTCENWTSSFPTTSTSTSTTLPAPFTFPNAPSTLPAPFTFPGAPIPPTFPDPIPPTFPGAPIPPTFSDPIPPTFLSAPFVFSANSDPTYTPSEEEESDDEFCSETELENLRLQAEVAELKIEKLEFMAKEFEQKEKALVMREAKCGLIITLASQEKFEGVFQTWRAVKGIQEELSFEKYLFEFLLHPIDHLNFNLRNEFLTFVLNN
jgi:hypothetical protein